MWKRHDPALDPEIVTGIIRKLMAMDAKLDQIRERLDIEDEEEPEEEDT